MIGSTPTRCPTSDASTPSPTATTSPAGSLPQTCGSGIGIRNVPERTTVSGPWLIVTAPTSTTASPGPATGSATSSYRRTSGPPCSWKTAAFISLGFGEHRREVDVDAEGIDEVAGAVQDRRAGDGHCLAVLSVVVDLRLEDRRAVYLVGVHDVVPQPVDHRPEGADVAGHLFFPARGRVVAERDHDVVAVAGDPVVEPHVVDVVEVLAEPVRHLDLRSSWAAQSDADRLAFRHLPDRGQGGLDRLQVVALHAFRIGGLVGR